MNVLEYCRDHRLILDGGMGSLLMAEGIKPGENTASWALSHPDVIKRIHKDYYRAGAGAVLSDTFAANIFHYSKEELERVIRAACTLAADAKREMTEESGQMSECSGRELFWGYDIGPLGQLLEPFGDLEYDEAVEAFAAGVRAAEPCEPDFYFIETMDDKAQTLAALQAVKENSTRPVFVSNTYDERGRLFTGASPEEMIEALEAGGADAIGINCSFGPEKLLSILSRYLELSHLPVFFKPNAGMPHMTDGKTEYDLTAAEFADQVGKAFDMGLRIAGGCCGTTPEFIREVAVLINTMNDYS